MAELPGDTRDLSELIGEMVPEAFVVHGEKSVLAVRTHYLLELV